MKFTKLIVYKYISIVNLNVNNMRPRNVSITAITPSMCGKRTQTLKFSLLYAYYELLFLEIICK